MKPIIKWSGGKSQEIKFFKEYFPNQIDTYIEPFFGGGAVFFELEHTPSIINDINFELVSLYQLVKNNTQYFVKQLNYISLQRDIFNSFFDKFNGNELEQLLNTETCSIDNCVFSFETNVAKLSKEILIIFTDNELEDFVIKSFLDKTKRIRNIEQKENKRFTVNELKEHFTTALQSSLYFYCRFKYNNGFNTDNIEKNSTKELSKYISFWYYVREFCYSSMFRFSKNGNFNVPYGGIGYNSKDFKSKINRFSNDSKLKKLLQETEIFQIDFEELFKKYNYFKKNDFIFLDPPYDSEFSQYNKEKDFDKEEQIRLRDNLLKVHCNFMVVIKETDFIKKIYSNKYFKIKIFDKKYMTNMRNRNNRDVQHLIITNY